MFNGSFETNPSGLPFDWTINTGSGATAEIVPRTDKDGQRALYVEFASGRIEFSGVAQWVMLAPGRYELQGRYKGELAGRRGLKWRVICPSAGPEPLAETAMLLGSQPSWKEFKVQFRVPDTGCRAQIVRLDLDARSASEQFISGAMWFDDLQILRAAEPETIDRPKL